MLLLARDCGCWRVRAADAEQIGAGGWAVDGALAGGEGYGHVDEERSGTKGYAASCASSTEMGGPSTFYIAQSGLSPALADKETSTTQGRYPESCMPDPD